MTAIPAILAATDGIDVSPQETGNQHLKRIVSMLTKPIARAETVGEEPASYDPGVDYEYRNAEYEYEYARKARHFADDLADARMLLLCVLAVPC